MWLEKSKQQSLEVENLFDNENIDFLFGEHRLRNTADIHVTFYVVHGQIIEEEMEGLAHHFKTQKYVCMYVCMYHTVVL